MIGEIILSFAVPVTMRRRGAATFVNGRAVPAVAVESTIRAAVVPATPNDVLRLPEIARVRKAKRVLTQTQLRMEPTPDEIVYKGETYEVLALGEWEDTGDFCDVIVARKPVVAAHGPHASTLAALVQAGEGTVT